MAERRGEVPSSHTHTNASKSGAIDTQLFTFAKLLGSHIRDLGSELTGERKHHK